MTGGIWKLAIKESMAIMNEFKQLDGVADFFLLVGQQRIRGIDLLLSRYSNIDYILQQDFIYWNLIAKCYEQGK